jgi:AraC family transcriptional regulator
VRRAVGPNCASLQAFYAGHVVFQAENFETRPYVGFETDRYARRTSCSWEDLGWRSLLVQRFTHAPVAEDMVLMGSPDVHLVLVETGRATIETRVDAQRSRHYLAPGTLGLNPLNRPTVCSYRAEGALRSVHLHVPRVTIERTAEQLGARAVDYESMDASVRAGDPFLEAAMRTLSGSIEVGDLYAESAAAFLAVHLVSHHSGRRVRTLSPVREDARVRAVIALMRERLAEPLTLAEIADDVYLSVFHLVRVFKEATGETPYRFLTRLRVEEAQRLLLTTDLSIAEIAPRCGFASPGALSTAFLRHVGVRPSAYRNF